MRSLGDWSYSIYLWHWPVLMIVGSTWHPVVGLVGLAVLAVALALSGLTYHFVENPFRRATVFTARVRRGLLLYPAVIVLILPLMAGAHASVVRLTGGHGPPITTGTSARTPGSDPAFASTPTVALVEASVQAAENGSSIPGRPHRPCSTSRRVAPSRGVRVLRDQRATGRLCPRGDPNGRRRWC